MNIATHAHRSKGFEMFQYRVTAQGVFCLHGDEWIKSSVSQKHLRPIGISAEEFEKQQASRVLINENCKSGDMTLFNSIPDAISKGFEKAAIYRCLAGTQKTYKGCVWRWANEH